MPGDAAGATACCAAFAVRRWEWRPWPHRYRVCSACGFEVDAAGWPVTDPGFGALR